MRNHHDFHPRATRRLIVLTTAVVIGCVIATASSAMAATTVTSAAVGTQARDLVFNGAALKPFVDAAKTRRVDIAGVGDSNQIAGPGGDYGWDHGYAKAWTDRYGEYATGLFGANIGGAWTGPEGYIDSWSGPYGAAATGAPAGLNKYKVWYDSQADAVNDFPPSYAYFGPTYVEPTNHWVPMLTVRKQSPLWGQNLRWRLTYGTFDTGAGTFTPSVSGTTGKLLTGSRVSTSTGTIGLADGAFNIPAAAYKNTTGNEINLSLSFTGEGTMRGPFFGLWQRAEGDRTSGVSYSTMLAQGGRAMVHAATAITTQSDVALREYVRNLVKLQDGPKMLLVQVNHGGNDAAFSIPSVGPNPAASNTPAGFADNMDALITRLRGTWIAMGYDPKNLMFEYGPYHPRDGSAFDGTGRTAVQRLGDWEGSIIDLSQRHPEYNLAIVRGSRLTTPITMDKNGWYTSPDDHAHLSIGGYIGVPELGVRQAIGYANPDEVQNRSNVTSLSFTFNSDVSANLSPDDLALRPAGSDALIDPFNFAVDWDAATLTATWTFQGMPMGELPAGDYEAIIRLSQLGGVAGAAGGGGSGDYLFNFTADPASPIPEPAGVCGVGALFIVALARRGVRR